MFEDGEDWIKYLNQKIDDIHEMVESGSGYIEENDNENTPPAVLWQNLNSKFITKKDTKGPFIYADQ